MNNSRNYRIDLLRAISMLLIVVQHYVVWGVKCSPHALFDTSTLTGGGLLPHGGSLLNFMHWGQLFCDDKWVLFDRQKLLPMEIFDESLGNDYVLFCYPISCDSKIDG